MGPWDVLFGKSTDGIWVADVDLNIVYINPAARRLMGISRNSGEKPSLTKILERMGMAREAREVVRRLEEEGSGPCRLDVHADESHPAMELVLSRFSGEENTYVWGVVRRLDPWPTPSFSGEDGRSLGEAVIENLVDGLFVIDPATKIILYANEAFHERRGLRSPLAVGQTCYRLVRGMEKPCEKTGRTCPLAGVIRSKRIAYCLNGDTGTSTIRLAPLPMGKKRVLVTGLEWEETIGSEALVRNTPASSLPARLSIPSYPDLHRMVRRARRTRTLSDFCRCVLQELEHVLGLNRLCLLLLDPSGRCLLAGSNDAEPGTEGCRRLSELLDRPESAQLVIRQLERVSRRIGGNGMEPEPSTDFRSFFRPLFPLAFGCLGSQGLPVAYYVLLGPNREVASRDLFYLVEAFFAQLTDHVRQLGLEETAVDNKSLQDLVDSSRDGIIGHSKKMAEVYELIDLVAASDATVLITGENGTGKELVARAIHNRSHRRDGPFVVAHCSAYSPTLLESELFGHEKGAFTGAIRKKMGRIERAQGGTLFLDEIGDIAPATQVLLLRFLQDHRFERVGGEKTLEADVRVLAATNRNLIEEVEAGRFRDDLYYRLNVISIHLPPLRERKEDIPVLSHYFLKKYSEKEGKKVTSFSSAALQTLMDYDWPGNVRQLENAVSHAVILAQDPVIRRQHLPKFLQEMHELPGATSLAENEKRLILKVLRQTRWNKYEAARKLQVSRSTLYSKIQRYGLRPEGAV